MRNRNQNFRVLSLAACLALFSAPESYSMGSGSSVVVASDVPFSAWVSGGWATFMVNMNLNHRETIKELQAFQANMATANMATNAAISRSADATDRLNITHRSNLDKLQIEKEFRLSDPCAVNIQAQGLEQVVRPDSPQVTPSGRGAAGLVRLRAKVRAMNDVATGNAPAPDPGVQAVSSAQVGCEFAPAGSERAKACEGARLTPGAASVRPSADIRAATFFDGPQGTAGSNLNGKRLTIDPDNADDINAITANRINMTTPLQLRTLQKGELQTDAGRAYLGLKATYDAKMSFVDWPHAQKDQRMVPRAETIPMLRQMSRSLVYSAYISKRLNSPKSGVSSFWQTKGVSSDEMMDIDVNRRYMNEEWLNWMAARATVEEVQREQVQVSSLTNVLLWQMIQEQRAQTFYLAKLYGSTVEQQMIPQLKEAHKAAVR